MCCYVYQQERWSVGNGLSIVFCHVYQLERWSVCIRWLCCVSQPEYRGICVLLHAPVRVHRSCYVVERGGCSFAPIPHRFIVVITFVSPTDVLSVGPWSTLKELQDAEAC